MQSFVAEDDLGVGSLFVSVRMADEPYSGMAVHLTDTTNEAGAAACSTRPLAIIPICSLVAQGNKSVPLGKVNILLNAAQHLALFPATSPTVQHSCHNASFCA